MPLRSLGFRTDLILTRFDGVVEDRGDYLVVRTPTNPRYYWGNLLIFDRSPRLGDFGHWMELFKKEIPDARHVTLGWDSEETGVLDEFLAAGFAFEPGLVLGTSAPAKPRRFNPAVEVKPMTSERDWERWVEIQLLSNQKNFPRADLEAFYLGQRARYRKVVDQGLGTFFGAYLGGELAGTLGILKDGSLGRYQIVSTHPERQRQGVCATLVHGAARFAQQSMGIEKLVMIVDESNPARSVYESVGFRPIERTLGVCKFATSEET